nr:hypothetical protein [Tanacetum cinerariifolium]
ETGRAFYALALDFKGFGSDYASRTELDRVIERTIRFARRIDAAMVDQAALLQVLQGAPLEQALSQYSRLPAKPRRATWQCAVHRFRTTALPDGRSV